MDTSVKDLLARIRSRIYKAIAGFFHYVPRSYPYVSGNEFRAMADHIYDDRKKCKPGDINDSDVVFVQTDKIDTWFSDIHPLIHARYILITHNSDKSVGEHEAAQIDAKILHWFAQNNTFSHEKITPIPIGLENRAIFLNGWALYKNMQRLSAKVHAKLPRILFGFKVNTNPKERTVALNVLRSSSSAHEIRTKPHPVEYFRLLNRYEFVASPEGNGPDCHRTWEALYLKTLPIVKDAHFTRYFASLGLPIWIVHEWSEIEKYNAEGIQKKYAALTVSASWEALEMDFWIKKIRSVSSAVTDTRI
jgi:hypothetical protein